MPKPGDVILAELRFTDTFETKTRPAVILYIEKSNVIVAGITSNTEMEGIPLTKREGAIKDSVIKLNYIFTISELMIKKNLFPLSKEKKNLIHKEICKKLNILIE